MNVTFLIDRYNFNDENKAYEKIELDVSVIPNEGEHVSINEKYINYLVADVLHSILGSTQQIIVILVPEIENKSSLPVVNPDIHKIATEAIEQLINMPFADISTKNETMYVSSAYLAIIEALLALQAEYQQKLNWISVDDEEPQCEIQDKGIFYSKYLELKVTGYEHPVIGYYVKANDDQFFDFIPTDLENEIQQSDVTHFRVIWE